MDVVARQVLYNRESFDNWERAAAHRARCTAILKQCQAAGGVHGTAAGQKGTLCVVGAGHCHDLDLRGLLDDCRSLTLVDLDASAVRSGVVRQELTELLEGNEPQLRIVAPWDVTGVAHLWPGEEDSPVESWLPGMLAAAAERPVVVPGGTHDVVASVCLLSQLLQPACELLPTSHPQFAELALKLRDGHLEGLLAATSPGGLAVLICDMVSSVSCPELPRMREEQLPVLVPQLIARGNFFTGTNPGAIHHLLSTSPRFVPLVERIDVGAPWLWPLGPEKMYLVYAFVIRRRIQPHEGE